ncbi:MAG: hypothetical protein M0Z66_01460 [Thermaerobacter sp.]|nr:hypothetical protein [Thermaerobacter sp.]
MGASGDDRNITRLMTPGETQAARITTAMAAMASSSPSWTG